MTSTALPLFWTPLNQVCKSDVLTNTKIINIEDWEERFYELLKPFLKRLRAKVEVMNGPDLLSGTIRS